MEKALRNIIKGIRDGKHAFCGPYTVQIDLTDKCNSSCIACWVHSPFVDKKEVFPEGEKELPWGLVESLISELASLGVREIILAGSGEPLLYSKIEDVIKTIKEKNMRLNVITNALLLNEDIAKVFVDLKVDMVTASVWAGSLDVYKELHPRNKEDDFAVVRKNLSFLSSYKENRLMLLPHLKIYNVICSLNYKDISNMVSFARETDADSVEFQAVDIVKGRTDFLAIRPSMVEDIKAQFEEIRRRADYVEYSFPKDVSVGRITDNIYNGVDFGRIWKNAKEGFQPKNFLVVLKCRRNSILRIAKDKSSYPNSFWGTYPAISRYEFSSDKCLACPEKDSCLNKDGRIEVKLLNILGINTFMCRCLSSDVDRGNYDRIVNSIPCYVGWYYSRVLTSGDVIPCCKAARFPLGNIYKNSFSHIWFSKQYNDFRYKAKNLSKTDPYFAKIECIKGCDNWGSNVALYKKLKEINGAKTTIVKKREVVFIPAKSFLRGNLGREGHGFGKSIVVDGGEGWGYAEYGFCVKEGGKYVLWSDYASGESRPVTLMVDDFLIVKGGMSQVTGGWREEHLEWHRESEINLPAGEHNLRLISPSFIPHIKEFALSQNMDYVFANKRRRVSYLANLQKAKNKIKSNYYYSRLKEIFGIFDGKYSYKGPFHVQIDLTNDCNNQCIACWCNSPLLRERRLKPPRKQIYLPASLAKELIDEIYNMGVTEIYFSGSGEPFMHPEAMEVFAYAKSKRNIICHINTNFTLLDRKKIDRLIDMGMDFLTVSVWAGTPQVYVKAHIGSNEDSFIRIKDNLLYLNHKKKNKPKIKLYNVMFSMNYHQLLDMVKFAEETRSDSLEFTVVDTIPGYTDVLALRQKHIEEIIRQSEEIKKRISARDKNGCYILDSGVRLFGFDQFLRRLSNKEHVESALYDKNIIDSIPCYIGWIFARIIPEGEIHSCLKAHRIPTGSLYLNRFSEIWDSPRQFYFRKKTRVYKKKDKFFRMIGNDPDVKEAGCYKSCDDILRNMWVHSNIKRIPFALRLALKLLAKSSRLFKDIKSIFAGSLPEYKKYHPDSLIAGILHGRKAFVGPEQVVIDPTNKCNLRCISCWLYSPLLKNKPSQELLNKELPPSILKKLINDLASLKTKRLRFTGGGEPFMYKGLLRYIELARRKDIKVSLTTNFTLVSKQDIKDIVALGVDELCVSLWASDERTYIDTHPTALAEQFSKLKDNLLYLKNIRRGNMRVTFANVISNVNYRGILDMYKFAKTFGADAIYFTILDVIPGSTDVLLLSEQQRQELVKETEVIRNQAEKDNILLEFFDGFVRRLSRPERDFSKGEFDKDDINRIPCYAGWIFARIMADGSVAPCCRGVKKIMGNINNKTFKEIWFSDRYNEFRARAKYQKKDTPYFEEIGCTKECDNLMHNEEIHRKLNNALM